VATDPASPTYLVHESARKEIQAAPRLREFSTHELANLAAAFASAGHSAPALLDEIAIEAAPRLHDFDSEQLRITARAYATAGHAAPALLGAIAASERRSGQHSEAAA